MAGRQSVILLMVLISLAYGRRQSHVVHLLNEHIDVHSSVTLPVGFSSRSAFWKEHPSSGHFLRATAEEEELPFLAHFTGPISETTYQAVAALSRHQLTYFPHDALLIVATERQAKTVASMEEVDWMGHFEDKHKLGPNVVEANLATRSRDPDHPDEVKEVVVLLHIDHSLDEATQLASDWEGALRSAEGVKAPEVLSLVAVSTAKMRLRCHGDDLARTVTSLAGSPAVHWVERAPRWTLRNRYAAGLVQSREYGKTPIWEGGLKGEGEIVSVGDTGLDANMCFFTDPNVDVPLDRADDNHRKILAYIKYREFGDVRDGHGTHVVGSMVGDALEMTPANEYNGMAPKAKVVFFDIGTPGGDVEPPDDLDALFFPRPYGYGSRIDSESWGGDATTYDAACREVDKFQYEHKDFMIHIACGNTGYGGAKTVATPGNAKNGLSIGSSQSAYESFRQRCGLDGDPIHAHCDQSSINAVNGKPEQFSDQNIACFSSRGPTDNDLRIKPDIVTPGYWIWSARSDGNANGIDDRCSGTDFVRTDAGTSMSSPIAAGASALVRQYFRQGYWPTGSAVPSNAFNPSASLLKAVIISGASSLTGGIAMCDGGRTLQPLGAAPNFVQGWGAMNLNDSLPLSDSDRTLILAKVDPTIKTSQIASKVCFEAQTGDPIIIVLAWTDPPASTASRLALINDLDLVVTGGDNEVHLGNHHLPNAVLDEPDTINNVEQVVLHPVQGGVYCAQVSATTVTGPPQDYSLVINGKNGKLRSIAPPPPSIKEIVQNIIAPVPLSDAEAAGAGWRIIVGASVAVTLLVALVVPCFICFGCRLKKNPGCMCRGRTVCVDCGYKCCGLRLCPNWEFARTTHCRFFGLPCCKIQRVVSFEPLGREGRTIIAKDLASSSSSSDEGATSEENLNEAVRQMAEARELREIPDEKTRRERREEREQQREAEEKERAARRAARAGKGKNGTGRKTTRSEAHLDGHRKSNHERKKGRAHKGDDQGRRVVIQEVVGDSTSPPASPVVALLPPPVRD